jgi:hypothetical protein
MRRVTTLFTGSGVATATTASALAAITSLTLVAGGLVISRVMDTERDRAAIVRPATAEPLGPIVIASDDDAPGSNGKVRGNVADRSSPRSAPVSQRPLQMASLTDVDRVSGTVTSALDGGEPGRMEEVGTIEKLESIIRSHAGHTTTGDGSGDTDQSDTEETDDPEDRTVLAKVEPAIEEAVDVVEEPVTELIYSDADAELASPSA